jgi:hypothetical protein
MLPLCSRDRNAPLKQTSPLRSRSVMWSNKNDGNDAQAIVEAAPSYIGFPKGLSPVHARHGPQRPAEGEPMKRAPLSLPDLARKLKPSYGRRRRELAINARARAGAPSGCWRY